MTHGVLERFTAADSDLRIDMLVQPAVSYATVSGGLGLVRRLTVTNVGRRPVTGLRLALELTSPGGLLAAPWTVALAEPLAPQSVVGWEEFDGFAPSLAQLRDNDETFGVDYRVVASRADGPSLRLSVPSLLLAHNEWFNSPTLYDSLAAFVQPSTGAVDTVLRSAAGILLNRTGSGALQGYQAGPERAVHTAGAIYESLRGLGIRLQRGQGEFPHAAHRVRPTSAVLNRRTGTSVDLAVAYAACCLAAGLRPVIWLTPRHAFAGFLIEERHLGETVVTDTGTLLSMVDSGLAVPVELTGIGEPGCDFTAAVSAGLAHFGDGEVLGALDVRLAHRNGIPPMAADDRAPAEEMPTSVISPVLQTAFGDSGGIDLPNCAAALRLDRHSEDGDDARAVMPDDAPARVQRWKRSLLDLSLRNPLLNLGGKGVELCLPQGALATLDDLIHDGQPLHLVAEGEVDPPAAAESLAVRRLLPAAVAGPRYQTTMRALQREARTLQQETGGSHLFLTLGTLLHPKSGGGDASAPLFLLPVRIEGGTGGARYDLVMDGTETAAPNRCLVEWLRIRHGVRIPQLEQPAHDEFGIDIPTALAAIAEGLVEHQLPFRVEQTASLRLLQFASFQLWGDLADHWQAFLRNPVVRHLVTAAGREFADPAGPPRGADPAARADALDEAQLYLPLAADSSQLRAIMMAEQGRSFVLEGAPGTGKSQTITNLIARSLAGGRTVLFVAEKETALDVVKRRLAQVGLAPFVLNLHGRKQTSAAIRQQLLDALMQDDLGDDAAWAGIESAYRAMVGPLAAHPDQVHRAGSANLSVWSAYEALLGSDDDPTDGRVDGPVAPVPADYLAATDEQRARVELALRELPMAARSAGLRAGHPWCVSGRQTMAGLDADVLTGIAAELEALRERAAGRPAVLAMLRGAASPFELAGMLPAIRLAARGGLTGRAPTTGVATTQRESGMRFAASAEWSDTAEAVEADLRLFHQTYAAELRAFRIDIYDRAPLDNWADEAADAASRLFGKGKRLQVLADRLSGYLTTAAPLDPERVPSMLDRLLAIRSLESTLTQRVRGVEGLALPEQWRAVAPDAVAVFGRAKDASVISGTLQAEHPAAWDLLDHGLAGGDGDLLERIATAWGSWSRALQIGDAELARWAGGDHWTLAWQRCGAEWLSGLRTEALRGMQRWSVVLSKAAALAEAGLADLHRQLLTAELPMPEAEIAYRRGLARAALDTCMHANGLEYFDPDVHDDRIAQLARVTADLRAALVTRLPAMVVRRRGFTADDCHGRVADVVADLRRRRGGRPFRDLFAAYPDVVLALTPCVLVSPASAAAFLPPDAATFDLVIFDEASQIRVADAIGPMGRGRTTVIVGDSQQMPPAAALQATGDPDGEDLPDEGGALAEDHDSILSEAIDAALPRCRLAWHYRSRNEALIAFANHHFYQDMLASLPSPRLEPGSAITWHRVAGSYERGGSRTNAVEATAVVAEVARRLADPVTAGNSIGIVTFNLQQRDLILNLLEESGDQGIRARMAGAGDEPLFVKNLENVQGDERDVILFSLGYAPNPTTGRLPLNFGQLSQLGGERRLNVAITRARREVALFASFDPGDIDLGRTGALGMQRLRQYCELAADPTQRLAELVASRNARQGAARTLVRDEIARAVRARGHEVTVGHGLSTFTVDLAVRTAGSPTWQVAVVLDGPQWSSRRTVADRDLAPRLLTDTMGWPALLRCWLPGWIGDRGAFLDQLDAALARCAAGAAGQPAASR